MRLVGAVFIGYFAVVYWCDHTVKQSMHKCWDVHGIGNLSCRAGLAHYAEYEAAENAKWKPGFGPNK